MDQTDRRIGDLERLLAGDRIDLEITNGWFVVGPVDSNVIVRKDGFGVVHFEGYIDGRNRTNSIFATLPEGFRPGRDISPPILYWTGTAWAPGRVRVFANGEMQFLTNTDSTASAPLDVLIENITFYASQ